MRASSSLLRILDPRGLLFLSWKEKRTLDRCKTRPLPPKADLRLARHTLEVLLCYSIVVGDMHVVKQMQRERSNASFQALLSCFSGS